MVKAWRETAETGTGDDALQRGTKERERRPGEIITGRERRKEVRKGIRRRGREKGVGQQRKTSGAEENVRNRKWKKA